MRINTQNIPALISQVENKWNSMAPVSLSVIHFWMQILIKFIMPNNEQGSCSSLSPCFAIFIACLGLFGLVTYAAEQRIKEIGIRKVLGASVQEIVAMISKDFVKLVLIAFLIAFPVAWWMMNKWLQGFAYRIDISWWVFALAGLLPLRLH